MSRTAYVVPVRYTADGPGPVQTTTRALTADAVRVRSLRPPATGKRVGLRIYLPAEGVLEAVGLVRESEGAGAERGFTAEFEGLSAEGRGRVERAIAPPLCPRVDAVVVTDANRRALPRFPARFVVRYSTPHAFVEEFAINISAGGLFIRTDEPPALHSVVAVSLDLPGAGGPVEGRAQVVRRVEPAAAAVLGCEPGVGVQFLDSDDRFRARIDAAIDLILQWKTM